MLILLDIFFLLPEDRPEGKGSNTLPRTESGMPECCGEDKIARGMMKFCGDLA